MDATTAVVVAMTSAVHPAVGASIACDAGPHAQFDAVLEQVVGEMQAAQPRDGAGPTAAAEAEKRSGHSVPVTHTGPEVGAEPARDDDGDGDEDVDDSVTAAVQQMAMTAAGSAGTAPVQNRALRRPTQDRTDNRATEQVEGSRSGSPTDETAMREREAARPEGRTQEQPAETRSVDRQDSSPERPERRISVPAGGHASQPEDARAAKDQVNDAMVRQAGRTTGWASADRASVRASTLASMEQLTGDTGRTATQADAENMRASAPVGRDERVPNGSPRSMDGPVTEPHVAPQVQERASAAMQKREIARPERRTPQEIHMAADHMNGSTAGRVDSVQSRVIAVEMPVLEHVVSSTERLIGDTGRTAAQVEPKNVHISDMPGMADTDGRNRTPEQPERYSFARAEGRPSEPETTRMAVDQMNSPTIGQVRRTTSGPRADKAPVRESTSASMEQLTYDTGRTATRAEPENVGTSVSAGRDDQALNDSPGSMDGPVMQPDTVTRVQERSAAQPKERSAGEQDHVSQQPRDRASQPETTRMAADQMDGPTTGQVRRTTSGPRADIAPVRESTSASMEQLTYDTGGTATQAEPENMRASVPVGRDGPALSDFPRPMDGPGTQPDTVPRVQERSTARPEERSAGEQDHVSQQPRDRASQPETTRMTVDQVNDPTVGQVRRVARRPAADRAPVRESTSASMEQLTYDMGGTATQAEPENMRASVPVGRDEPALNGSPRSMDGPVTQPDTAPRVQERGTARPEGRSGSKQDRVSQQPGGRTLAPVDGRAWQPEGAHLAKEQVNDPTVRQASRTTRWPPVDKAPIGKSAPVPEPGIVPEMVETANAKAGRGNIAESRQARSQPDGPRLIHRHEQERLVSSTPDHAERREPAPVARPGLAVAGDPVLAATSAEGPAVSHASQAGRPAGSSVMRQIASHVSARAAQGGGTFRARLVPEHLGSVEIRVRVVRGICTADIRADDAEVARFIESHSSDLKVSLAEHGVDLAGLSVSSRSRAQEGWSAAVPTHAESDWSAPSWNGADARQQYAAAAFAGGSWGHGRGERRGALMESGAGMADAHSAVRQSGSTSPDEPIMARWARGYARIDYLA